MVTRNSRGWCLLGFFFLALALAEPYTTLFFFFFLFKRLNLGSAVPAVSTRVCKMSEQDFGAQF